MVKKKLRQNCYRIIILILIVIHCGKLSIDYHISYMYIYITDKICKDAQLTIYHNCMYSNQKHG